MSTIEWTERRWNPVRVDWSGRVRFVPEHLDDERPQGRIARPSRRCSFCSKSQREVRGLVEAAGRPVRICNECVGLCVDILKQGGHYP